MVGEIFLRYFELGLRGGLLVSVRRGAYRGEGISGVGRSIIKARKVLFVCLPLWLFYTSSLADFQMLLLFKKYGIFGF